MAALSSLLLVGGTVNAYIDDRADVNASSVNVSAVGINTATSTASSTGISGIGGSVVLVSVLDTTNVSARIGPASGTSSADSLDPASVTATGTNGVVVKASLSSPAAATMSFLSLALLGTIAYTNT